MCGFVWAAAAAAAAAAEPIPKYGGGGGGAVLVSTEFGGTIGSGRIGTLFGIAFMNDGNNVPIGNSLLLLLLLLLALLLLLLLCMFGGAVVRCGDGDRDLRITCSSVGKFVCIEPLYAADGLNEVSRFIEKSNKLRTSLAVLLPFRCSGRYLMWASVEIESDDKRNARAISVW